MNVAKKIINNCIFFVAFFVMDVNALAASMEQNLGLGVQKHTQEEIQAFAESHPAKRSQPTTYTQAPSLSVPFSPGELSAETAPKRPSVLLDSSYDSLYSWGYTGCSNSNLSGRFSGLNQAICGMFEDGMSINSVGHLE